MPLETSTSKKGSIYSDFFNDIDNHPERGDLLLNTNEEAVKQSLKNLLFTNRYERLRQPELAGDLNRLLFELADPITETIMRDTIVSVIAQYEPRAKLIGVIVKADPDTHSFEVTIKFYIINILEPTTLTVVLRRVR